MLSRAGPALQHMTESIAVRARKLYHEALVWDAHAGFESWSTTDLSNLREWKDAGVDYLSVNVGYDLQTWQDSVKTIAAFRRWLDASDEYELVHTVAQARAAKTAGRMAVTFDMEGMNALDGSLDMLRLFYDLGVRQMLFAYNRNSIAGGGCHDDDQGLTPFGRDVVRAMNELGMLVDCSHCGYRTTMEAMQLSSAPVIFSHSNPRALVDHERNILDEQARACAATGGVVGVNGIGLFLGDESASTAVFANHVEYYLDLIGFEHIGIGVDYFFDADGDFNEVLAANAHYWPPAQYPGGSVSCAAPAQLLELTEELLRRHRPEGHITAVLGGNFARVAQTVWG